MSMNIVALQCPVCGAPFGPNDEKCGYCGSILVLRTDHPKINIASLNKQVIDKHIAEFRADLRKDPHNAAAHYGLGVAYFNLRLTDDAVRELEDAARLMPENPNIQSQLAVVLNHAAEERRPGAIPKLRDRIEYTLRLDPNNYDALLLKAENDPNISDYEALELLERARSSNPDRKNDKLIDALKRLAKSNGTRGTEEELALLRRAASVDSAVSTELFTATLKHAQTLSASDPAKDAADPMRAAKAIELWEQLFEIDSARAQSELDRLLATMTGGFSKGEIQRIQSLKTGQGSTGVQQKSSGQTAGSVATSGSVLKAIGVGFAKAIGMLIIVFVLFGIFSNVNVVSQILAFVFVVSLFVLPILMPILEVRKLKNRRFLIPGISSPGEHHQPTSANKEQTQYLRLLDALKAVFYIRWTKESPQRILQDSSKTGTRGERDREKIFRASLSMSRDQ